MIHLLIADDHAAVRQGLRLLFELVDDVVVAAEAVDGDEALQAVERGGIDLALIDLSMPGLSGVELIEKIHVFNARLPIVVLSMHSELQVIQRALVAGASRYLVKGCDSEEIVDTVRRLCRPARQAG
ncbi:response regulator transcription factor [Acidovorax sp. ACV01]|uniref:response regulator n=1 Tax=Acidovorax sp. ACV01 TaxID=2769311 RepID=UPI00177B7D07|nr:response regulator transcription factor [Acidovorax sp. ACV01]MBD9391460.1 response regulator transcription factor [Acidovorax sp. ACV01]